MKPLKVGLIFLTIVIAFVIIAHIPQLFSKCLREPQAEISDIQIQSIDENTVEITWKTDRKTYGSVEIKEQDKVNGILKNLFSCDFRGNLTLEGKHEDIFKKHNCSFVVKNGIPYLVHDNSLYNYCAQSTVETVKKKLPLVLGRIWKADGIDGNNTLHDPEYTYYTDVFERYSEPDKYHSVTFNVLQPDTEYVFHIHADIPCRDSSGIGYTEIHSEKTAKFRTHPK